MHRICCTGCTKERRTLRFGPSDRPSTNIVVRPRQQTTVERDRPGHSQGLRCRLVLVPSRSCRGRAISSIKVGIGQAGRRPGRILLRAVSSVWSEHLAYTEGVGGSSPSPPTIAFMIVTARAVRYVVRRPHTP